MVGRSSEGSSLAERLLLQLLNPLLQFCNSAAKLLVLGTEPVVVPTKLVVTRWPFCAAIAHS